MSWLLRLLLGESGFGRISVGAAMVIALGGGLGAYYVVSQGGAPAGTANIWVDTTANPNNCTYSASPVAYVDAAACSTFDAAWDKMSAGNTARVVAGTYPGQLVSGNKASTTKIIADGDGNDVTLTGADGGGTCSYAAATGLLQGQGNFMWIENMTLDQGSSHGTGGGGCIDATNVTYKNVALHGLYVNMYAFGNSFHWDGGELGCDGCTVGLRCDATNGDSEPIWLDSSDGTIIENVTIWPQGGADTCGVDGFHEEDIRIQSGSNITIRNVYFPNGDAVNRNAGSGKIFLSTDVQNLVVQNVVFGGAGAPNTAMQDNCTPTCSLTVAYSTFIDDGLGLDQSTLTEVQNYGPGSIAALNITADGHLEADASAAIDQAETGTGSDYCVNELGSRDRDGDVRPKGAACDKGADEF